MKRLTRLRAREFRSLANVDLPLGELTVLVGPNGSGKTNVLNVLRFLASTVRFDLANAIEQWGGFSHVKRQSIATTEGRRVALGITGVLTQHASATAQDEYDIRFGLTPSGAVTRSETFVFKRYSGQGRRIRISGSTVEILDDERSSQEQHLATKQTTGLATLPRLADDQGGEGIRAVAEFLSSIRVLEPDVTKARAPSRMVEARLADDASNLSAALFRLMSSAPDNFLALVEDMKYCLPGLEGIDGAPTGGAGKAVTITLRERGLRRPIELADASFGTVRLLSLLTALHEPDPPPFTAIEEIDHGLHPYALDVLVERLRAASSRTQVLVATHSPTLVNRLAPDELVICDRDSDTAESLIPAATPDDVADAARRSGMDLGELWFAGSLGGTPGLGQVGA